MHDHGELRHQKAIDTAKAKAGTTTEDYTISSNTLLNAMKQMSRASMEDLATELTNAFGGARGLALALKDLTFSP